MKSRLNEFNRKAHFVFPFDNALSPDIFFAVGIWNSDCHNIFILDFAHFSCRDECPAKAYVEKGSIVSSILMGEDDICVVSFSFVISSGYKSSVHFESHFLVYQGLHGSISRTI